MKYEHFLEVNESYGHTLDMSQHFLSSSFFELRTCCAPWDFDRWILMTERVGYQKREKKKENEKETKRSDHLGKLEGIKALRLLIAVDRLLFLFSFLFSSHY